MQPTDGALPEETREILDGLRRLVRVLRESHGEAERLAKLSAAQIFVLQALADARRLTVNELAERTYTHQSSVSAVAAKLAERGLLFRARGKTDARQVELRLTPAGKDALRRAPRAPQERIVEGLARMTADRRAAFAQGLSELLRAMGAAAEPAGMFFEDSPVERPAKRSRIAASRNRRRLDD